MEAPNLWAIVVVLVGMLTGPQVFVVSDSTFHSKAECEAKIAASVPSTLEPNVKKEWKDGYRTYTCVRVHGVSY